MNFQLPDKNYKEAEPTDFYIELNDGLKNKNKIKTGYFLEKTYHEKNPYYSFVATERDQQYLPVDYINGVLYRYYVDESGKVVPSCTLDGIGIRPVISYRKLKDNLEILRERKEGKKLIVTAGEWIQDRAESELEWELQELNKSNMIQDTGRSYHVGITTFKEKIYNNKRYVRMEYPNCDHWFSINLLEWEVDLVRDTAISRKILFPTRYLQNDNSINENIPLQFLNNVFSKEIMVDSNYKWIYTDLNTPYIGMKMNQQVLLEEKRVGRRIQKIQELLCSGKNMTLSDKIELLNLLKELQSIYRIDYDLAWRYLEDKMEEEKKLEKTRKNEKK